MMAAKRLCAMAVWFSVKNQPHENLSYYKLKNFDESQIQPHAKTLTITSKRKRLMHSCSVDNICSITIEKASDFDFD
jgi:hypothetical protein